MMKLVIAGIAPKCGHSVLNKIRIWKVSDVPDVVVPSINLKRLQSAPMCTCQLCGVL